MNFDDPAASYDSPVLFFDMPGTGASSPPKPMAKPKLNLRDLDALQKVQKANDIVDAMTGNANYPAPNPVLAAVTAKSDALSAAFSAREVAKQTLDERQELLATAGGDLDAALTGLMAYVESASGGDAAKILSAGFEVRGQASPPAPMAQVEGLDSTIGDMQGRVVLRWTPVRGAKSYEVQTSPDPITSTSWAAAGISTRSTLTLDGLPIGARCWFRVRAIGSAGPGPWSDPAVKTVP